MSLDNNTNNSKNLYKEEKLKRRQEQLAAWKQKKATESKLTNDDDQVKKLERQKKIEDWKRKRLQAGNNENELNSNDNSNEENIKKKSGFSLQAKIKKVNPISKQPKPKKRLNFNDDEENTAPVFKKPNLDNKTNNNEQNQDQDEIDELDKYLNELNSESNVKINKPLESSSESEDELIEDDEDQKLLNSKLQKLQEREKALETVDHSKIDYKPFRKNFYTPSNNITSQDIEILKNELSDIKVKGNDCPGPINKWSQLGLSTTVLNILHNELVYESPSPIQSQALPCIMQGRDIIGVAKTGSGKTMAFILPMLRHIQDQEPLKQGDGPIGLILTPTRELAIQVHRELCHFTKVLNLTSCCCYGGSSIEPQIAELKKGVQIIVGTPGRVIDLLTVNNGRISNLRRVTYLVLDEADRMFDMGFEPQVNKIFNQVRPDKQTVLFSATFPKKMESLARKNLTDPIEIITGGISVVASEIHQQVTLFDDKQGIDEVNRQKSFKLLNLLDEFFSKNPTSKVLIFVEKQEAADKLLVQLISGDYPCLVIHGGKDQIDRKHAIKEFSSQASGVNILIATSIAARGLDVKGLDLVINYDAPSHMEDYVHRVGRTGRAGMQGTAVTFVTSSQQRAISDLVKAMETSGQTVQQQELLNIRDEFLAKVKLGKEKYSFGFGGKGLDKLQQQRDNSKDLERQSYDQDSVDINSKSSNNKSSNSKNSNNKPSSMSATGTPPPNTQEFNDQLPDFTIIEGRAPETSGPDKCKYHSRITINDLPQKARWVVVNKDSLSKITETTGTSITNKGQYYAPNIRVKDSVPKLYLLVEGLSESSVNEANQLLKQKMIEGLQLAANDQSTTKYTV